ncbi:branched-chain amino acid ABC transporter permease [Desulfurispora thermophila]|uniref:branched-chain amino acid ABC transporter permease n=1 Tax=Desulfurispora thermophila TaxID=265470 RepID=UPI00038209ED|nr:branched-chain amino acid ABC transporter permease [Desulfurispora thermophila]
MLDMFTQNINPYYLQVANLLGIYIILALGLNLITGVTGQLSFGHAAFMSIGAYTAALLTLKMHLPFALSLLAGGCVACIWGVLIGFPTLRLTGDYLGIATLGFGEIVLVVFTNLQITGGAIGLAGIPRYTNVFVVYLLVAITVYCMYRIQYSRFGRALLAIREDEIAAAAMGINTTIYKVQAFAIGAFFAGLAGGLYAHLLQYLNPNDFGFARSFEILNFVVLGGLGSIPGTILGTVVLTLAPEFLRFIAEYRMMIYGLLLVVMMIFRPNGLLGGVDLSRVIKRYRSKRLERASARSISSS